MKIVEDIDITLAPELQAAHLWGLDCLSDRSLDSELAGAIARLLRRHMECTQMFREPRVSNSALRSVLETKEGPNDFTLLGLAQQRVTELQNLREIVSQALNARCDEIDELKKGVAV